MGLYTDLAAEAREMDPAIAGVEEEENAFEDHVVTRIDIKTPEAAEKLGKRMGRYVTVDAPELLDRPRELARGIAEAAANELSAMLEREKSDRILVIGLGNREVTPDSLGPRVIDELLITRHVKEFLPEIFEFPVRSVAALAPGVMGTTGIETLEIIKGMISRIQPSLLIVIDSLASRRAARISTTIQISDAGIEPGSGVGNVRAGINRNSIGIPVISIGVPMVVYASTITHDAVLMMAESEAEGEKKRLNDIAERITRESIEGLIVTPKDIDRIVRDMAGILAEGVNRALFAGHYEEVYELIK